MTLAVRSSLVAALLTLGLVGQVALQRHLQAAGPLPWVPLARPLAELSRQIGDWRGRDVPIRDPRSLYADEHLQREYVLPERNQALQVWIVYSRDGEDRGHHPEVCMAVSGKPEDPRARRELPLPGGDAPVQQYRYGRLGDFQRVFYWYYTLSPPAGSADTVQRLYQRARRRPSSVTIEVFAPETGPGDVESASRFVALLDEAVRDLLPDDAVRGSRRTPVTYVNVEP